MKPIASKPTTHARLVRESLDRRDELEVDVSFQTWNVVTKKS